MAELKWTQDKPTTEGHYLYMLCISGTIQVAKLTHASGHLSEWHNGTWCPIRDFPPCYWYGPLPEVKA